MEKLMLASQSIIMTAVTLHRITRSLSVKQVAEIQRKIMQSVVSSSSVIHLYAFLGMEKVNLPCSAPILRK